MFKYARRKLDLNFLLNWRRFHGDIFLSLLILIDVCALAQVLVLCVEIVRGGFGDARTIEVAQDGDLYWLVLRYQDLR